ncbi:MAG: 30S ribosomal protein S12 methylthiotransferase RimO [Bacteroides sp.]|nr:30S ribosomal protein S12 methylthiotransferase RimO [Bacteroides sp.]
MPSLKVVSLGCSKNTVDSEVILGNVRKAGWSIVDETSPRTADVVLINTCGFILDAKEESIDAILAETACKNRRKKGKVFVMGCLVQRHGNELKEEIPDVDAWFGVNNAQEVVNAILQSQMETDAKERKLTTPMHYAYLKVSEGCDRRCAFCAIPLIRGRHISRPKEEILQEARMLAKSGVREVILVAQDLTYYGMDLYGKRVIADLVRELCRIDGLHWIRLQYLYPHAFPKDLLDVMRTEPKVCRYVDIPLQHINSAILKDMARNTSREQTLALLRDFREALPDAVFRTTLITGFPGEDEAAFEELKAFVQSFRFDRLGVFPYSREEGTPAYASGDTVSEEEKERRAQEIMAIQEGISYGLNQTRVGKTYEVLIDRMEGEFYVGRTQYDSPEVDNEVLIPVDSAELKTGEFYNVRITSAEAFDLYGTVEN